MGWRNKGKLDERNMNNHDRAALGCAYCVGAATFLVMFLPCLLLVGWFYKNLFIYFALIFILLSVIFSYRIINKVAQDIEQDQRYQRYQILKSKYPRLWRQTVRRHFEKSLVKFIIDSIYDSIYHKSKSAVDEFLEEANKWEPPNTSKNQI
jgi:cobalamin biosynthesis protein CobD/CbiB